MVNATTMNLSNKKNAYGFVSKFFHWIMAVMLIGAWLMGNFHGDVGSWKRTFIIAHYTLEIIVFVLVGFRLVWRFKNITPKPVKKNKWLNFVSNSVFTFFYSLMFLMPLSGYIMMNFRGRSPTFFGYKIPALFEKNVEWKKFAYETHEILGIILLVLFIMHVAAALYHHYVRKDLTLKRMIFFK